MTAMDNLFYRKDRHRFNPRTVLRKLVRNRRLVLALIVIIPLVAYTLFSNHGILQRIRLQNEKTDLEEKIRAAEAESRSLQEESKALDTDKKEIERVAREKHHMVREGEQVYRVKPEK